MSVFVTADPKLKFPALALGPGASDVDEVMLLDGVELTDAPNWYAGGAPRDVRLVGGSLVVALVIELLVVVVDPKENPPALLSEKQNNYHFQPYKVK